MGIFAKKDINLVREAGKGSGGLKKTLTATDLILLGIGAVVGTGIFVLTGKGAQYAGPGLSLSFLLSGITCMFVALAYTEVASMIPTSGSVYTYSYIAIGELAAWVVMLGLLLELGGGAVTVAAGWSGYFVGILKEGGIIIPEAFSKVPSEGGIINLPAMFICVFLSLILVRGTKESAMFNTVLVFVKLGAIFLFLLLAAPHFDMKNWDNFTPFGFEGIAKGAGFIFLAYTGFDALATAAEECKNPERDISIGLIGSLLICTVLYMAVAAMLTGILPFGELNNSQPVAHALRAHGSKVGSALVATGAIAGMTTVILVQTYALSRILFVISRDGLLPKFFSKLHSKYSTPYVSTLIIGVTLAIASGFMPIHTMNELASCGTLLVFMTATAIVMILRVKLPDYKRPFKCPAVFIVAPLALLFSGYLLYTLLESVGMYFLYFLLAGTAVYFVIPKNVNQKDMVAVVK